MDWKETVFATVLFATFTLAAVKHGWTQIEVFGGNVDPSVFIREAHEIARTGDLITSRDPPLRYVPLAFLYTLVQPHGVLAEQIASLHAALFSFVVLPAGIACLAYVVGNRGIAYLSVIVFGMGRLFGFGTSGFHTGAWQYDIAAPLVFVTLAALHQSLSTTGIKSESMGCWGGRHTWLAGDDAVDANIIGNCYRDCCLSCPIPVPESCLDWCDRWCVCYPSLIPSLQ